MLNCCSQRQENHNNRNTATVGTRQLSVVYRDMDLAVIRCVVSYLIFFAPWLP